MYQRIGYLFVLLCSAAAIGWAADEAKEQQTPLTLSLRYRESIDEQSPLAHTLHRTEQWQPHKTALIICDMWDTHTSHNAVLREKQFAPRLQEVTGKLRDLGVTIIHAPSGCMDTYAEHPARQRAINAPQADSHPKEINAWCYSIPAEEQGEYPIDQSDGGRDDDPADHERWVETLKKEGKNPNRPWTRQIDVIKIDPKRDFISDVGSEVWNILQSRRIDQVMIAGVHTNMCVLGRPFGLRQMARNGKNVVLIRDLTDTMYNPASKPMVSHFTGTDLIVGHIERYVCPTITSDQIIGGDPFRFAEDDRPHIVMLVAEREYKTDQSLAEYAVNPLGKSFRTSFVYADADDKNDLRGIEVIQQADLLMVSVRRRTLKTDAMQLVREYVAAGKPVVGIRTASHAFHLRDQEAESGYAAWPEFDAEVFGGNYSGHHSNKVNPQITFAPITHPILASIDRTPFESGGSLYKVSPLAKGATVMLTGKLEGAPAEPVAWTFHRDDGGRSFCTSLGHVKDFDSPQFRELLGNGIRWALDR
ncbi:MAG: isochorismatase family protein [Pirellulaceae bacterium]